MRWSEDGQTVKYRAIELQIPVFVEDGLVAVVTSYHKGYTCTVTTKIIRRYLPRVISELAVY